MLTVLFPLRRSGPKPAIRLARRLTGLAAGFLCLGSGAMATTVRAPEFTDLVNQSDCIVRAVVKSVSSEYAQPGSRKIITKVELDVREVIAGKPPQPLVLQLLGGRVGAEEMRVEGVPQFKAGDEDILFVQGNGKQVCPLVAIMHGRYPILREAVTGREYMARSNQVPLQDTSEVVRPLAEGGATGIQARMKNATQALTPAEFAERIRAAVKSSNTRLRER